MHGLNVAELVSLFLLPVAKSIYISKLKEFDTLRFPPF